VVSFYVFDHDKSNSFRAEFQYEPSQGLTVALNQYAPGKSVWIDSKEWTSGAIYAPFQQERSQAWRDRTLYFECQVCHYACLEQSEDAAPGDCRDCPACKAPEKFGRAMNWMRPPGFAHPVTIDPETSPDDQPARSYATRAKLMGPGPAADSEWQHVTERLDGFYRRDKLLVTNTGPKGQGYNYCTICGLIEPTAGASGIVRGTHKKPYPDREPDCPGSRSTSGVVLGTNFISDVLLARLKVEAPVTLQPQFLATHMALRTIAEAMTIASAHHLDIEATELQAEYRPALTPRGGDGLEAEIYLYDTLPGGAGFTHRVHDDSLKVFEEALHRLKHCPADCDASCYRCLRSFRNRFEHSLLDRHVGASLLSYLLDGKLATLPAHRLALTADRLYEDLTSRGLTDVSLARNAMVPIPGIGPVEAPILATRDGRQQIIAVHGPLTPDAFPDEKLQEAKEFGASVPVIPVDYTEITHNLPSASERVLGKLGLA
jgi:hypothetical protein